MTRNPETKEGISSNKDLSLMNQGNFMVCIDLMDLNWYCRYVDFQ